MSVWFPTSRWGERGEGGSQVRFWEVIIEPLPPADEICFIMADLARDGSVYVEQDGRLRHDPRCHAEHNLAPELPGVRLREEAFLVDLMYREPPGYPAARCIDRPLSKITLPDHPHFYNEGIICPIFPPDGSWQWRKNTAADYLTFVSIWLFKTVVWMETKKEGGAGIWMGSAAGHAIDDLLRIGPDADCPCGSGRKYRQCCRTKHVHIYNFTQTSMASRKTNEDVVRKTVVRILSGEHAEANSLTVSSAPLAVSTKSNPVRRHSADSLSGRGHNQ